MVHCPYTINTSQQSGSDDNLKGVYIMVRGSTQTENAIATLGSVIHVMLTLLERDKLTVEDMVYQAKRINEAAESIGQCAWSNVRITGADVD